MSVNPLGFYRQCSGQKLLAMAEQVAGLNTGDRTLVGFHQPLTYTIAIAR